MELLKLQDTKLFSQLNCPQSVSLKPKFVGSNYWELKSGRSHAALSLPALFNPPLSRSIPLTLS